MSRGRRTSTGIRRRSTCRTVILHPEGARTDIGRDIFGKPTSLSRKGGTPSVWLGRSYTYDARQRLCKRVEPEIGHDVDAVRRRRQPRARSDRPAVVIQRLLRSSTLRPSTRVRCSGPGTSAIGSRRSCSRTDRRPGVDLHARRPTGAHRNAQRHDARRQHVCVQRAAPAGGGNTGATRLVRMVARDAVRRARQYLRACLPEGDNRLSTAMRSGNRSRSSARRRTPRACASIPTARSPASPTATASRTRRRRARAPARTHARCARQHRRLRRQLRLRRGRQPRRDQRWPPGCARRPHDGLRRPRPPRRHAIADVRQRDLRLRRPRQPHPRRDRAARTPAIIVTATTRSGA